ncbi:MAG: response regulator [Acidobacteria bacterium]|nr:response regulator [Acidobacteriota bacterium]
MQTTFAYQSQEKSFSKFMPIESDNYKGEILIVDDEPNNLEILSKMLISQNYDVRVANSGQYALAAIKSSAPDIILMDINMPLMNGYETSRHIKANPNSEKIPIIFVSANSDTIDKIKAFNAGGVDYITKPFQVEEVIARIENQLKIARLSRELYIELLRYQLNPHFLFNSLNSIRALVSIDSKSAEDMITQLSEYLRYLLINRKKMDINVNEEIEATLNYLAIEKIRFKDKLIINTSIDEGVNRYSMPAFLLQPLVENAIKYGMATSEMPLVIEISAQIKNEMLIFSVSNTGYWVTACDDEIPQASSLGVGLQNIKQRLRECYPSSHSFTIINTNDRVCITIEIPIE